MPAKGTKHKRKGTGRGLSWKGIPIREPWDLPKNWTTGKNHPFRAAQVQGRPSRYTDAEELAVYIDGYFRWNEANPLTAAEVANYKGRGYLNHRPIRRIATMQGMCAFLGLNPSTWAGWKRSDHDLFKPAFLNVIEHAETLLDQDKIEGAASGQYNPTIASRLLGLTDKQEVDTNLTVRIEADDGDL